MKLFIDESGNTGGAGSLQGEFNFSRQPYYALAALLLNESQEDDIKKWVSDLKKRHKIQGLELKARNMYESKIVAIWELMEELKRMKIPAFVELMDKRYYLSTQIVTYVIVSRVSVNDRVFEYMNAIAEVLPSLIKESTYHEFVMACDEYNDSSFKTFIEILLSDLKNSAEPQVYELTKLTYDHYMEGNKSRGTDAFKRFLPSPDLNPKSRLTHLLPNYHAFSNIVARVNKYRLREGIKELEIVHDEQPQFGAIYESALNGMKTGDTDRFLKNTNISHKGIFNLDMSMSLTFKKSEEAIGIQVADVVSGFGMRVWQDFMLENLDEIQGSIPSVKWLVKTKDKIPEGTNFVVPNEHYWRFMYLLRAFE